MLMSQFHNTFAARLPDRSRGTRKAGPTRSGLRKRGATGEFAEGGVTDILKVGDADFAGGEGVAGEIAQERKEGHAQHFGCI